MASQSTHLLSAEQMMLNKMEVMRSHLPTSEFAVSANPIDKIHTDRFSSFPALSFSQAMISVMNKVDSHQVSASEKMTAVETGKSDDLVGAMIASQKANLSLTAMMQVSKKVISSLEDIRKMPV